MILRAAENRGKRKPPKRDRDPDAKPWLVFDLDRGYVWGPGHERWAGQLAGWDGPGNDGRVRDK